MLGATRIIARGVAYDVVPVDETFDTKPGRPPRDAPLIDRINWSLAQCYATHPLDSEAYMAEQARHELIELKGASFLLPALRKNARNMPMWQQELLSFLGKRRAYVTRPKWQKDIIKWQVRRFQND